MALVTNNTITQSFKVFGNCGMCKTRIEKSVSTLDGISKADWNRDSKIIEVIYDESKVEIEDIHKVIAKVGHDNISEDNILYRAEDEIYASLHGCCKYERPD